MFDHLWQPQGSLYYCVGHTPKNYQEIVA